MAMRAASFYTVSIRFSHHFMENQVTPEWCVGLFCIINDIHIHYMQQYVIAFNLSLHKKSFLIPMLARVSLELFLWSANGLVNL